MCVPLVPLVLHPPSVHCSEWFGVAAYGGQKPTPWEIIDALIWVFVQGFNAVGRSEASL